VNGREPLASSSTARAAVVSEPTPWATGLPLSLFAAVVAALADVTFAQAVAGLAGPFWIPANLAVCLGLVPGVQLLCGMRFWRWPAAGAVAGLVAAWAALLVTP